MRTMCISAILALAASVGATATAAQTSIALSAYGAFNGSTNGKGTVLSPANQAGGLIEFRHIANPLLGFESTYSFNRANQNYATSPPACPAFGCTLSTETVRANAHQITVDWVPSLGFSNLRPFAVLGVGLLLDVPSENQATVSTTTPCSASVCPAPTTSTSMSPTTTSARAVYVYGAGLDWGILPHLGLRFQYRGNLYKAPNVTKLFSSTSSFTQTAEPMVGAYFNF